ncbi:unnamed protein product [Rhizopus stolonifer]
MPTFQTTRLLATKAPQERKKIILKDENLIEHFCVDLRHIPTGVRVQCQQLRSLADNRGIARKLLREKLDELENGSLSKVAKKAAKIVKQKARRAKRAKSKYGAKPNVDTTDQSSSTLSEADASSPIA